MPRVFAVGTIGWILLSFFVAFMGRNIRIGFWGTFFCSLLLSPLIVFVFVVLLSRWNGRRG
jgi:uncharacterized membrane protein YhaH (DUF805 family)